MRRLVFFLCIMCLVSCHQRNTPVAQRKVTHIDTVFTTAYAKSYGAYYKGLNRQVMSLDLYSEGLTLHKDTISGTGTNLYFSDIFADAGILEEGEYTVDSTANSHTALSAMSFEGSVTGTYLLLINDSKLERMYLFPSGTFAVQYEDKDTCRIDFHLLTDDKQTYDAVYRGKVSMPALVRQR